MPFIMAPPTPIIARIALLIPNLARVNTKRTLLNPVKIFPFISSNLLLFPSCAALIAENILPVNQLAPSARKKFCSLANAFIAGPATFCIGATSAFCILRSKTLSLPSRSACSANILSLSCSCFSFILSKEDACDN